MELRNLLTSNGFRIGYILHPRLISLKLNVLNFNLILKDGLFNHAIIYTSMAKYQYIYIFYFIFGKRENMCITV